MVYLFVGIAIVCDELFVASLEVISEKWNLSDDVSGATLMAAGGSAPELATSFIGTFQGSTVGLGTIVGSAVFNVLFVIGMCAICTPKEYAPLKLTWWPLARDCSYYIVTLGTLAMWFTVPSPGLIQGWEAGVQWALYFGYVFLMKNNEQLEAWVKEKTNANSKVEPTPVEHLSTDERRSAVANGASPQDAHFLRPSTFRTSVMHMLTKGKDISTTAGVCVVSRIKGDVSETFNQLDTDSNGRLDFKEIKQLLARLGDPEVVSDEKVEELKTQLDIDKNNHITLDEFTKWYISSESRLKSQTKAVFDTFDLNKNNSIDVNEVREVVKKLSENNPGLLGGVDEAVKNFKDHLTEGKDNCNYDEFQAWYESTVFWKQQKQEALEAAEHVSGMRAAVMEDLMGVLKGEKDFGEAATILALLPLNCGLAFTIPDCRVPGHEHYCYFTFAGSIVWIGAYSWGMVYGITQIGCFTGIPIFIMGLTFLAAGTSVPDLLSSVVVAKQGKGDMAVSSSIGSNIFDVAVGLPLPWLCFVVYYGCPVPVGGHAEGNGLSVAILLAMVAVVIVSIASSGWKMSQGLGYTLFGLYFVFVAQELFRNYS